MDEGKTTTATKPRGEISESGSTVVGGVSALLTVFFLYAAVQRLWWSLSFGQSDYLLYGLTYFIAGIIAIGGVVYGLSSRKAGAEVLSTGTVMIGAVIWIIALYYWLTGFFLGGTQTDIFNALSFGLAGVILYAIGYVSEKTFTKRGIIEDGSIVDTNTQNEDVAERIEQKGDEIED